MNNASAVGIPLLAIVIEGFGTLLLALGSIVLFAPEVLATVLPRDLLTAAVGWTAVAVGLTVSLFGVWQMIVALRRRAESTAGR